MGSLTTFSCLMAPNQKIFGTFCNSTNGSLFATPVATYVLPKRHLFNLYRWELNFGQIIWDKTKVLLGTFWGTSWEHIGNMLQTRKKGKKILFPPPRPPQTPPKEKKTIPPPLLWKKKKTPPLISAHWGFHWLHATFISICFASTFCPG
jgi:hypothetical protein